MTVEPGSPVPDTVSVPLGFAALVAVGASGAVESVYGVVAVGETFPEGSVTATLVGPDGCGAAEVTE